MSVISVLKSIIIAAFVVLALVVVAANIKLPQGYGLFVVQSGSMEPAIPVASVVLTKPTADFAAPIASPRFLKGDVVTFSSGSSLVSHRVVETVEKDGQFFYETKGDANNEADQTLVAEKAVVGKVKLTVPYLGRFVNFAKQPLGYFLMILIPSFYVILSEIWIIIAELRRSRTKIRAAGIVSPIVILFAGSLYLVGGTAAFFSDTVQSSGNVFQAADSFRQLKINEVYYNVGAGCGNEGDNPNPDEWVELYNPTSTGINLKNWTLTDNSSTTIIHSASKIIPAGGFALISKDAKTWTESVGCWSPPEGVVIVITGQKIGNGLDNTGDRLILKDNTGAPIDAVSWGTDFSQLNPSGPTVTDGHSIERSPLGTDTDTASDWSDNPAPSPGTP